MVALRLVVSSILLVALSSPARAATIVLPFGGTADLSSFGGTVGTPFAGTVEWDTSTGPQHVGADWARYLLDGSAGAVRATFELDGFDYTNRIRPLSRFEVTPDDLFLQLFFEPVIQLDAAFPQIDNVALDLWTDHPPAFVTFDLPPQDLAFLSLLEHRRFVFIDEGWWGGNVVTADALSVPEPAVLALFCAGLAVRCSRRRSRSI